MPAQNFGCVFIMESVFFKDSLTEILKESCIERLSFIQRFLNIPFDMADVEMLSIFQFENKTELDPATKNDLGRSVKL